MEEKMADELGSGDLLLGAMPKKFQILKKTRIGFLTIHSKVMNVLMKFMPSMQLRFSGFCPDIPHILFDASCIRMGNPLPLENQ